VVLLIAAETALEGKLDAPKMLIYWGVCILLTMVSIVVALSEARAVQRMAKKDQSELFEETLRVIEREKLRSGQRRSSKGAPPNS
jgi:hypothetical protein